MLSNKQGTNYFYQWDTNQHVVLSEDLAGCTHVHFKNPSSNTAYRVIVVQNEARIPDELLQSTDVITAWVYDDAETRTVDTRDFYILEKQKPSNYEFTPTDAEVYQTLNDRMATMEKILNTSQTTTPIPGKQDRAKYVLLAVKKDGAEPVGTNFGLDEFLQAEVTQEELDAVVNNLTAYKAEQAETDRLQNVEINKKVDGTAYSQDKTKQSGIDAAQDALIKEKLDSHTYTTEKQAQDELIASKADGVHVEQAFALKADKTDTYTKTEVDTLIREGILEGEIYGVDFNMATREAKRLDAAVGMEFHRFIGGTGSSPVTAKSFMSVGPWANIHQTLRTVEGNSLVARTGDANFESAYRSGECSMYSCIPKYYVKSEYPMINGQPHWIIRVSAKPFAGAFSVIDGDSTEIATFPTATKNGKHVSQPGLVPLVSTKLSDLNPGGTGITFERQAEKQGLYNNSWNDFMAWWLLLLVQTASLNSQNSVARGCCSTLASWGGDLIKVVEARSNSNEIVMGKWGSYAPGMTVYINKAASSWYGGGLGIRRITNVAIHPTNSNWMVLTVDGEPLTTEVGDWCSGCGQIVDEQAALDMGLNCGYWKQDPTASESICHAFVYGICDPWANIFTATSGIVKYNDKLYIASGRPHQPTASELPSVNWHEVDDFPWIGEGWPSEWRIQQAANSISMVPTKLGGNENVCFGDYMWGAQNDIRLPWRGGHFSSGGSGGATSFIWLASGSSGIDCGGRLTYQKAS